MRLREARKLQQNDLVNTKWDSASCIVEECYPLNSQTLAVMLEHPTEGFLTTTHREVLAIIKARAE